ncbi:MAG: filamentous hemagglutinin N-terminal domain-containing protein [Chlamydiales bacterium]
MQTVSGKATCKEEAGTLVIESGKRAIVKWDEFSIGKGECVRFSMPDSKSAVLNRVSGGQSRLLGQLDSNGKVYLLNPKGVLIGKDAIINTASFVASSLDVLDQDFLRGEELLFSGDSDADIVNLGTISCLQGDVALIAHNVANRGKIEGDFVGLASGPEILLKPEGNQRIFVKANGGDSIQHSGEIHALAAELRSASVYDHAINMSGKIDAVASETREGRIYLVAENGRTTVEGNICAPKGEVHLLGDEVYLAKGARVDVSAVGGGGTIIVGGDQQGENPDIFTSSYTWIADGAEFYADALETGHGGKIVCWANKFTNCFGTFSVRGGEQEGNGGFVEVSSREFSPQYGGRSDRTAPNGNAGILLIDPEADITINAAGPDSGGAFSGLALITYTPTATSPVIETGTLVSELGMGNVLIKTSTTATAVAGTGTIVVNDPISWTGISSLEFEAASDININDDITNSSATFTARTMSGDINLSSATISTIGVSLISNMGQIDISSSTITTTDFLTMSAIDSTAAATNAINLATATVTAAGGGTITGTKTGGTGKGIGASSSTLTFGATGSISGTGIADDGISIDTGTTFTGSAGTVTMSGTVSSSTAGLVNGVLVDATSSILGAGSVIVTGTNNASGAFTSLRGVLLNGCTVTNSGSGTFSFTGNGGAGIALNYGVEILNAATITSSSSGGITVEGTGGAGTTDNFGVFMNSGASITTTSGDILIEGNQSTIPASTGTDNFGVNINGGPFVTTVESTGSGSITIRGQGGSGINSNRGVRIDASGTPDAAAVKSATGSIVIEAEKSSGTNTAFQLLDGALIRSTGGSISVSTSNGSHSFTTPSTVEITGGSGTLTINATSTGSSIDAISFSGVTISSTGSAAISGTKTGGTGAGISASSSLITFGMGGAMSGTGISDDGISFVDSTFTGNGGTSTFNGVVSSSTLGSISGAYFDSASSLLGSGSMIVSGSFASPVAGVSDLTGIFLDGTTVTNSGSGTFTFSGTGGASGTSGCNGIQFSSATVTSTTGNLTFNGVAGNATSANSNDGISLNNSTITTTSGNVTLNGNQSFQPSSTGGQSIGIIINGNASVTTQGSGRIRINGRGGKGTTSNFGVQVNTASITSNPAATGSIRIHGVGGNGTDDNFAVFLDTGAVITSTAGNIVVNGNQTATLPSGSGGNFMGLKLNGGASVTSLGSANITMTCTGGNGTGTDSIGIFLQNSSLTSSGSGSVTLTGEGGIGTSSLQGVRIENSPVTLASGKLTINGTGGEGSSTDNHGIVVRSASVVSTTSGAINFLGRAATNSSTNEGIRVFNSGSSVTTATGSASLTGFASGSSTTGIHVTDSGSIASTGSAPITLQTFSDVVIDEGGAVTGGSGLLEVISDRDLIIRGGTTDTTPSGIFLGSGNGRFIVARNLSVFGGSGNGSFAQIGALTDSSANLDFIRIGNRLLVDGISTNSYALIGHGDPTVGGAVFSGNILFREIRGETIVRGAATAGVGTDGFAQIGHIDGAGATLSGDVKFLTKGSLFVLGGLATVDAYARIGHGGQSGGGTFGASIMDLLIGRSIQLTSTTAEAQIVNPSPSSPLILVVDNLHPKPPEFGLATFTQKGTLTANGELRIYTVDRALNTITNMINGEVFAPPALQIDNPQEEFSIYFPDGTFSTASFRIYYKTPIAAEFPHLGMYRLGLANAQLQDELPIFRYMRLPNYPQYHANFCGESAKGINCLNNLDPYGSFIFEDNVYWVGGR